MFTLTNDQRHQLAAWIRDIEAKHGPKPEGAAGGRYTYEFTPTGLGVTCVVRDGITGESIDLTNYGDW